MSKWWIWLREDRAREERIKIARCRGRSRRSTMTIEVSPRTYDGVNASPATLLKEKADQPVVRRCRFTDEEKRHSLNVVNEPGSSISDIAQHYDLALSLLFRWRKERGEGAASFAGLTPVTILDEGEPALPIAGVGTGPILSEPMEERSIGGIEIALKDGKRVLLEAGTDAVRQLVTLLEGAVP